MNELRAALTVALAVALHETADPSCSGMPPYDVTHEQAEAIVAAVMRTPVLLAALAAPAQMDAERLWNAMYDANQSHGGYECCAPPTHANAEEIAAAYALAEPKP